MIPLLRKLVTFLAVLVLALVLIAVSGGIGYSSRTVFRIAESTDESLTIHIQDSAQTSWGNADVMYYSVYGAPYIVYLSGNLPPGSSASQASVRATVQADGAQIAQVEEVVLRVSPVTVYRADSMTVVPGFGPEPLATFETLPHEVVVSGTVVLNGSDGKSERSFVRRFPAFEVQKFRVGPWRWERNTPPPNPSIERTSPGKPGAASHVKR
jgi:hypothetical protein